MPDSSKLRKWTQTNVQIQSLIKQYSQYKHNLKSRSSRLSPSDVQKLFGLINAIGMNYALQEKLSTALEWLHRAQKYEHFDLKLKVVLKSNLACIYKKMAKFNYSLRCLSEAQSSVQKLFSQGLINEVQKIKMESDCHLNRCAILSAKGFHAEAFQIICLTSTILEQYLNSPFKELKKLYYLALYNQAVQSQHLQNYQNAFKIYQKLLSYPEINQTPALKDLVPTILKALKHKNFIPKKRISSCFQGQFSSRNSIRSTSTHKLTRKTINPNSARQTMTPTTERQTVTPITARQTMTPIPMRQSLKKSKDSFYRHKRKYSALNFGQGQNSHTPLRIINFNPLESNSGYNTLMPIRNTDTISSIKNKARKISTNNFTLSCKQNM